MHVVIAFFVIAGVATVPCFWIAAFASAMGGVRSSAPVWPVLGFIVAIAFVGSLLFGGVWALLAPLFGG